VNFGIDSIVLWSKENETHTLEFKRNKVNIITGESQTGKSTLLKIFDYCFLASDHDIPHDVINDNVGWYGIKFYINDKDFFLARRSPNENFVSYDYYFSSMGEVPGTPTASIEQEDLRKILEAEFSIDDRIKMPFGGRVIKAGSKVSFRYFFLFNTMSDDIILNSKAFFDKQEIDRYREALPRIFDLALGIDDLENIVARERREHVQKEIAKLERKKSSISEHRNNFSSEIRDIASKAAEFGLAPEFDKNVTATSLRDALASPSITPNFDASTKRRSDINSELFSINRQIRKYSQFTEEYKSYKSTIKNSQDSLKPLKVLMDRSGEIIKSSIFDELISSLQVDLRSIDEAIKSRRPVESQVSVAVKKLQERKQSLQDELQVLPEVPRSFKELQEMWVFLGEARGKLSIYARMDDDQPKKLAPSDISGLASELDSIQVKDVEAERAATISLIDEVAAALMLETGTALENYATWYASFNYKEKKIQLRKPKSTLIENVGSSSNHMFLHLIHSLALHEVAINKSSKFIPSFLIIDQPSRPYWGEDEETDPENLVHSDRIKIRTAFEMLNNFISRINNEYDKEFQIIVFEHVPASMFFDMTNIHLLPVFRGGNALIPSSWKNS
jgi:energy-coupling factor transporter ATP-binding protein EcfA2